MFSTETLQRPVRGSETLAGRCNILCCFSCLVASQCTKEGRGAQKSERQRCHCQFACMTVPGSILKTFYHWCLLIFLSPACCCHAVEELRWLHEPVRTVSRVFHPLFHSHADVNPQSLQCEKLDNESGQSANNWCKTWSTNTPNCITGSQCVSVKSFWDFSKKNPTYLHLIWLCFTKALKIQFQPSGFGADAACIHQWLSEAWASTEAAFPQMYLNKTWCQFIFVTPPTHHPRLLASNGVVTNPLPVSTLAVKKKEKRNAVSVQRRLESMR